MNELTKWRSGSPSLRRLELALEPGNPLSPAPRPLREELGLIQIVNNLPPRIDLIRSCAQHGGNPWAAVYLLNSDGGYEYSTSVAISKTLYRTQYAPGVAETLVWNGDWIDDETCALCGASGHGAVHCGSCRHLVCRGRSTGEYFRCFCGAEGWIKKTAIEHPGVIPRMAG